MPLAPEHRGRAVGLVAAISVATLIAAISLGARHVAWLDVARGIASTIDADVVWHIRLPRVVLGFVAGATLAVGGLALQAVFRNPLATPYTLGISAGASVGAAVY